MARSVSEYPPATAQPCSDCPWRRIAAPGWLGPYSPEEWRSLVNSDLPIACHQTILRTDDRGVGFWSDPAMRQCRGAAIFRANMGKWPRDADVAHGPVDREKVFATNAEFMEHHS